MRKFRILALMLVLIMVLAGCGTGNSTPAAKDIVILYTNDAHCGIEDGMGYQGLSAAKRALLAAGNKVLLVDNGDAVQGDTIGTLSKGEYIIDIMNKLGYDVATPGNHEFDYGMDQFNKLVEKADFDYISCNFVDKDGNPVLEALCHQGSRRRKDRLCRHFHPQDHHHLHPHLLPGWERQLYLWLYAG